MSSTINARCLHCHEYVDFPWNYDSDTTCPNCSTHFFVEWDENYDGDVTDFILSETPFD